VTHGRIVRNEVEAVSAEGQLEIGSDFLGYRIEELIGRGGMGVVYRAYDLRLKRTVALKLVTPELALDERFRARFARETELAMALEHPNVVPIHDAGDVDGRLYLAMRLVEGTDLRALLVRTGALEPARALAVCRGVASALDAAHARGLVHRDVKPSNVLLDRSDHVYLADFGLTRRLEDEGAQQGEGRSVGTPAYLAPEQIEGAAVDGRADVYALGCLLFECLTGEPPFGRGPKLAVAWAHLETEPPRASERRAELPDAIDAVLRQAMAKRPDERFPTCAALLAAAEDALGFHRPRPPSRRRLVAAAVAAAVIVAAALAALALTRGKSEPAAAKLFARPNTVARIDPITNSVTDVVAVGRQPAAVAAAGGSVWVYNAGEGTVQEIDASTDEVRHVTRVNARPIDLGVFAGPVLAADRGGAWIVGIDRLGLPFLTRVLAGGRGMHAYRLRLEPTAVAVGYGAVWVVVRGLRESRLLRVDPRTGRARARAPFPVAARVASVAVGGGAVWLVGSISGTLYRVGPRSGERTGEVAIGERAARPRPAFGSVLVGVENGGGQTMRVDALSMVIVGTDTCCPPEWGDRAYAHGTLWWYDWPTGSVLRQGREGQSPRSVRVVESAPVANGPCLTSLAVGAGGVWVTVASSRNLSCRRSRPNRPLTVAEVAAANRFRFKQRVVITSRAGVSGFVLTPRRQGPVKRDAGDVLWGSVYEHYVTRDGLPIEVNDVSATFAGKRGSFVVHFRIEWRDSGNDYVVGTGTWDIVRGTGAYAHLAGGGEHSASWPPGGPASFRSEGFVFRLR
jgi:hypothetical protein